MSLSLNNKNYKKQLNLLEGDRAYFDIGSSASDYRIDIEKLPFSIRVLLENVLDSRFGSYQPQLPSYYLQAYHRATHHLK